jgi:hypothetical protein
MANAHDIATLRTPNTCHYSFRVINHNFRHDQAIGRDTMLFQRMQGTGYTAAEDCPALSIYSIG